MSCTNLGFIYILRSLKDNRYYLGSTQDFKRRLQEHNSGKVYSTKRFMPFELIFTQQFESIQIARRIEIKLKKLKRKDYLESIIKDGLIKMS